MKTLQERTLRALVASINAEGIQKKDIVQIFQVEEGFVVLYY